MSLYLMWSYKRSGGTLTNKYLASCSNTIVISEVGLYGAGWGRDQNLSPRSISDQMQKFYNIDIEPGGFFFELRQIVKVCKSMEKRLILRDWCVSYFEPVFFCSNFDTHNYLNKLKDIGFDFFSVTRNKSSLWESLNYPSCEQFCEPYDEFTKVLNNANFYNFDFDDLCRNSFSQLDYYFKSDSISFLPKKNFYTFSNVLGDTQVLSSYVRNATGIRTEKKKVSVQKRLKGLITNRHKRQCFNDLY